jgi:outer membrane receptor protein involved in Fe transport
MAPEWTGSLGFTYEKPISDKLVLTIGADARYSGDYLASAFGNPLSRQSSYINLDGQIRVSTADDRWELALIGKNLTNRFYVTGGYDAPSTGVGTGGSVGRLADQAGLVALPRAVQMQLTWRY